MILTVIVIKVEAVFFLNLRLIFSDQLVAVSRIYHYHLRSCLRKLQSLCCFWLR